MNLKLQVLVEMFGGKIGVESEIVKDLSFYIEVPV